MKLHHVARWLLAAMLVAVLQPLFVVQKAQAAATYTKTISLQADKSVDALDPWPRGVDGLGRHLVGFQYYGGVNYGDSRMYMKFPIDASQIPAGAVIQKAELLLNVYSVERSAGLPAMTFRAYSSNETGWGDADRTVPSLTSYKLIGSFVGRDASGIDQAVRGGNIRLPITGGFNDYLRDYGGSSLITIIFEGPTEQELKTVGINTNRDLDDLAYVTADTAGLYIEYTLNTAPKTLVLSSGTVAENSSIGTTIGTFSATDDEGGPFTYSLAAGGVDNAKFQIAGDQLKTAAVFDYETKNSYSIKVQVADSGGLTLTKDFSISITNVNEAPIGSVVINGGQPYTSGRGVTLALTGTDPDGDALQMSYSSDNLTWSVPETFASTKAYTLPSGDGLKTVYFKLSDGGGLTHVSIGTIMLDTAPPVGTLSINGGASYASSSNVTLNMTATDLTAMQMRISNDNNNWSAWEPFASMKPWMLASGEGSKSVYVELRDVAGNVIGLSDSIDVDTTPPDGTLTIEGGKVAVNHTSVQLQIANPDITAVSMRFQNEAGAWSGWEPYTSVKSWTLSSGEGLKKVSAQLVDAAGNVATISDEIELDTTPPTIVGVDNGDLLNADVTITFEGTGTLDGGTFASGDTVSAEGVHTLAAADQAGNTSTVTFTIDKTAPVGSIVIDGGASATGSATVGIELHNSDGTAVQMRFSNDGLTYSGWEAYASAKSGWTLSSGDGLKTVYAQLKDEAGNIADVSDTITLDKTSPIVDGVADGGLYNADVTITFNEGTAALDGSSFTSGGEVTAEGLHTLIVTDQAGNTTTITFTLDKTAPNGTLAINGGDAAASSAAVDLTVSNPDGTAEQMRFSNDGMSWSAWEAYASSKAGWTLDAGDGVKTVYVELKDAAGNVSQASDSIELDTTGPSGGLTIAGGAGYTNQSTVGLQIDNADGTAVSMRFSNDGMSWSAWEAYASSKTGWALTTGDGLKTVYVELKDSLGNVLGFNDTITLDTKAPVIAGVTNGGLYNADLTITFDEGDGDLDGKPFVSGNQVTADGTYTLTVTDAAGNVSTVTFTLDKTAPNGSLSIKGGAAATNDATVSLTISNPDGTAEQMRFSNDGTTWSAWEAYASSKTGWTLTTGDGLKTVYVELQDQAGNVYRTSDGIELDTTGPSGSLTIAGGQDYTNQSTVSLQLDNPDGTAVSMRFSNNGTAWSAWEAYAVSKTGWALATGDGLKTVYVELKDSLGNVLNFDDTITLDTKAPVIAGVTNGGLYNADLTITFDEGDGDLDGKAFTSGNQVTAEGTHTLTVTDTAGNVSTVTFTLDKTAPTGTIVINGGAGFTNTLTAALAFTSDGTADQMRFSNDGTTWSAWESFAASKAWTLAAGDGAKSVRVQLKDAAGNIGSMNGAITVDTTAPTGSATINGGAPLTIDANVVVVVTAGDAGASASGVAQISYSIDNGTTWSAWSRMISTLSVKLADGYGERTVMVKVKDTAGNESASFSDGITVRSVPFVNNHATNGTEDTPYSFTAADFAVTNIDGSPLSAIQIFSLPAHGTLKLRETAVKVGDKLSAADALALVFTPEANWNGQTSLTWKGEASGVASSLTAVLTLTVAAVNDAPVVSDAQFSTTDSAEVKGALTSTDVDGDTLTFSIVDQPTTGRLQLNEATGAFTYKPDWPGAVTFTYRSFDGAAYSNTATVTITNTIQPVTQVTPSTPNPPQERPATLGGDEGSPLNGNLQTTVGRTELGNTVTVTITGDKWAGELPGKPGDSVRIVVMPSADAGVVLLDSSMTDLLASGSRGVTVDLGGHSITLPDEIMSQLAGFMKSPTAVLRIEVAETSEANAEDANKAAKKSGARIVAVPMQYQVYIEDGGKRTNLSSFNGYLDIHYTPEELQGAKPTTAALVGPGGKLRPLPTKFDRSSSSTDIRVHGLTHGTFVLIETGVAFSDTNGHWAKGPIDALADRLVINGVGNGKFEPNRTATRAEFSSILVQAFGMYGLNQTLTYSDTSSAAWYAEALQFASGYGIITGYSDGSFRPNATITREEAMVIMARTAGLLGLGADLSDEQIAKALGEFGDREALHGWSREAAALCVTLGVVNGVGDNLQPGQPITRAQLAIMVDNLLKKADYI